MHDTTVIYVEANRTFQQTDFWNGPFYLTVSKHLRKFLGIGGIDWFVFDTEWWKYLLLLGKRKKERAKREIKKLIKIYRN